MFRRVVKEKAKSGRSFRGFEKLQSRTRPPRFPFLPATDSPPHTQAFSPFLPFLPANGSST